jgi:hypothetical protein
MEIFLSIHQDDLVGTLSMFDRSIFRGYLTGSKQLEPISLSRQGVLLKDFSHFVQERTQTLKAHLEALAQTAGRPVQYLWSSEKLSKEDLARSIAERNGVSASLAYVFSILEICMSFDVQGNRQTHKLEMVRHEELGADYYDQ